MTDANAGWGAPPMDLAVAAATPTEAVQGGCQEAADNSHETYVPCNRKAESMVSYPSGEGPYRMCDQHTHHNLNNRGGILVGPYEGPAFDALSALSASWPTAEGPAEHVAVEESQEAFFRRRDDELQQWLESRTALGVIKEKEATDRAAVTQTLFPTPVKGTQRYPLNGGYAVKLVHGWTYTLGDKDKLGEDGLKVSVESQVVALEERIKALSPEGELIVRRAIRWKPELVPAEYEKLGAAEATATENQAFDLITEILTIKPASPQLTFEEPKAPK